MLPNDMRRASVRELAREFASRGGDARLAMLNRRVALDLTQLDTRGELVRDATSGHWKVLHDVIAFEGTSRLGQVFQRLVRLAPAPQDHQPHRNQPSLHTSNLTRVHGDARVNA